MQIDAENLCSYTLKLTNNLNNFPKKYRFTLVDRLLTNTFDLYDNIVFANSNSDKDRIKYIKQAIARCNQILFYLRMIYEVLHPQCNIELWSTKVSKIQSQLINWQTYTNKHIK